MPREVIVDGNTWTHEFTSVDQIRAQYSDEAIGIALAWCTNYETLDDLYREVKDAGERADVIITALLTLKIQSGVHISAGYPQTNVPA